jgi:anti-sigma regulatory factor (Ser/Thr protein kinase)
MAQGATDRMDAGGSTVSLAIPADPASVGTVRYFAASIARHAGLPEELINDLRLAVSEACAEAIDTGVTGSIRVALSLEPEGIDVEVTSDGSIRQEGESPEREGLVPINRLQLIGALFPDAETDQGHGMRVVRFTVPHASSSKT